MPQSMRRVSFRASGHPKPPGTPHCLPLRAAGRGSGDAPCGDQDQKSRNYVRQRTDG